MDIPSGENPVAQSIAQTLVDGFNKHYRLFRESSAAAKMRFETADWLTAQRAVRERIAFYDERVDETVVLLQDEYRANEIDANTWQLAKLLYIGLLINHKQPELAETFFNSVFCKIMHRTYFHNDFIFVRPAVSTDFIEADPPAYRSYYPNKAGLRQVIRDICRDFAWQCPFADLDRDVEHVIQAVMLQMGGRLPTAEANFQLQVLHSAFYRNKGAYIVGKAINGDYEYPFVVPVLHDDHGQLFVDAILMDPAQIRTLFSLSRAYFMTDMEVPSAYVKFLSGLMPHKPQAELYTMLGLAKQGKTMFYRDLMHHLRHSQDEFIVAPGIRGLVMAVFTLPSFPYVFKLIRDRIALAQPKAEEGNEKAALVPASIALWASVSAETDVKIREQVKAGAFPVRLKAEEWNDGDIVWLLDVIAPTQQMATAVLSSFNKIAKRDHIHIHPIIRGLVDPEVLRKLTPNTGHVDEQETGASKTLN